MRYDNEENDVHIRAESIDIGVGASMGRHIDISVTGKFALGDRSHLGDDVHIRGRHVEFGADLYHSQGLRVGGGGCDRPWACLAVGDRVTLHNNFLNICQEIMIGDDVGLSPEVALYCHYFWGSVLEGYPQKFAPIHIHNGVIIGYRSLILPGVTIRQNAVVGAHSVVTKNLGPHAIYAGNPARFIRDIEIVQPWKRPDILAHIVHEWKQIADYHGLSPKVDVEYPWVYINGCRFNVEDLTFTGQEDDTTSDWRDHARRYGLRFYGHLPFKSALRWE